MGKHIKPSDRKRTVAAVATTATFAAVPILAAVGQANAVSGSRWDQIAQCESGGDWAINYSSDGLSVGGLQFQNASWQDALGYLNSHGYNTSSWAQSLYQGMPRTSVPSKAQQITAGEALLKLQPDPWQASRSCSGVTLSQSESVFNGGPVPAGFITAGSNPPPTTPPPVTPPPPTTPPPVSGHGWHGRYTVVKGDNLSKIGHRYGVSWQRLYCHNRSAIGSNPNLIHPGLVLRVPG